MLLDVGRDHLELVQDTLRRHMADREVWAFGSNGPSGWTPEPLATGPGVIWKLGPGS